MTFELSHTPIPTENKESTLTNEDFSQVLQNHALLYKEVGYYWQVGEITLVQGWILHISVVRSQIRDLLQATIPILISHKVPFKIVKDKDVCKTMLDGDFGRSKIGKVICIYPPSIPESLILIRELVLLTESFKGPAIPTDFHLGGTVYTRYGSFNPIMMANARGIMDRYIYDMAGNFKPDTYTIPFSLPKDIEWPFHAITNYQIPVEKKVLRDKYKIIGVLSCNAKGNVFKAIYLKRLLLTKPCVIKQGNAHMWSDDHARDMKDRLYWQWQLYRDWATIIRVPKMIDLFEENGNTYLAMEKIKGKTLHDHTTSLNYRCDTWQDIPPVVRQTIIRLIKKLLHITSCIHQKGYVHRDITPVNFLVEKKEDIVPIDAELSVSVVRKEPSPPFEFGTHGFMSPEQTRVETPTVKEDVFGLCATLITLLVGLPPSTFEKMKRDILYENLLFFIGDAPICQLLTLGMQSDRTQRPSLKTIQTTLETSVRQLSAPVTHAASYHLTHPDQQLLRTIIQNAIGGLVAPPMSIHKGLWHSRVPSPDNILDSQRKEFGKSGGTYEGITGVLYLLSRAHLADFDIEACLPAYEMGWSYVREKYCKDLSYTVPGLYGGAAGIALALVTGMKAGLLQDHQSNRSLLQASLEINTPAIDLAQGVAGQGIVVLQCQAYLDGSEVESLLSKHVKILLSAQHKTGDWVVLHDIKGNKSFAGSLSFGNTGILWFLLEYNSRVHNSLVQSAIDRSLSSLCRQTEFYRKFLMKQGFRKVLANPATADSILGTVLALIKAYEVLREPAFRTAAEGILDQYPACLVHENISQDIGLAGMGELYLEAYRTFGDTKWKDRAYWLVKFLIHTRQEDAEGRCHWLNNNEVTPTADLGVGNSGVIHFLIRAFRINQLGYRLFH